MRFSPYPCDVFVIFCLQTCRFCSVFFIFHELVEEGYPLHRQMRVIGIYVDGLALVVYVDMLAGNSGKCRDLLGLHGELDLRVPHFSQKSLCKLHKNAFYN